MSAVAAIALGPFVISAETEARHDGEPSTRPPDDIEAAALVVDLASHVVGEARRRDHATLFAFGLPLRRILRMDLVEGILLGLLGTTVGIVVGRAVLGWVTTELMGNTMPDATALVHPCPVR